MSMRIMFMGTPDFAVPSLEALYNKGHDICAVISQPDKPKGRGKKLVAPPVKDTAQNMGLKVYQPERIKNPDFISLVKDFNPEMIVVVAFGHILPKYILDIPSYGCINVHASLLPKLRGAAPINWCIINGDKTTGITTMYMDTGLDTGDMIIKKSIEINEEENAKDLHDRLSFLGAETLIDTVELIFEGKAIRIKQNHEDATYAPILTKETGKIDWSMDAISIRNLIRGTYPWPGAYSYYDENMFKIFTADTLDEDIFNSDWGKIHEVNKDCFIVKCGKGYLKVKEIQFQNQKRMSVDAYLRGHSINEGIILS